MKRPSTTSRRARKAKKETTAYLVVSGLAICIQPRSSEAFSMVWPTTSTTRQSSAAAASTFCHFPTALNIQAPPGSGYFSEADEFTTLPDTYEPMMEYPGTMRPGKTPENIPFQDLPIADSDPDPVPWPHFQEIEWHHRWDPPHEYPTPMERFIEQNGRWATPELEAEMRAGVRRGVREKKELEEAARRGTIITDDDEDEEVDDEEMVIKDDPVSLGDGVFGKLGSAADQAQTAAAVDPNKPGDAGGTGMAFSAEEEEEDGDEEDVDSPLDDFLFDLGLDSELEEDGSDADSGTRTVAKSLRDLETDDDDDEEETGTTSASQTIHVEEEDDDLDFDEDEIGGDSGGGPVPLDDFGGGDDSLDDLDIFDEGGFDFGSDFDDGGSDMW